MKRYEPGSIEYYLLKNWNWLLFDRTVELDNKGKFNKRLDRYVNYRQLLELLLSIDDRLRLAWQIKEEYTNFNATATYESAQELLEEQIQKITISNIPEYGRFLSSICHWRKEIVNSFITYKRFRLNNGVAESLNATVSTLLFNTRGIRNSERRKKRIMYAVNKDQFLIG
jgi:transposase